MIGRVTIYRPLSYPLRFLLKIKFIVQLSWSGFWLGTMEKEQLYTGF